MSYIWIMCCTDAGLTFVFAQARLYVTNSRFSDPQPEILMHVSSYVASCWRRKEKQYPWSRPLSGLLYIVPSPLSLSDFMIHYVSFEFFNRRGTGLSVSANKTSWYRIQVFDFLIQSFTLILLSSDAVSCWHRKESCSNNIHEGIPRSGLVLNAYVSHSPSAVAKAHDDVWVTTRSCTDARHRSLRG